MLSSGKVKFKLIVGYTVDVHFNSAISPTAMRFPKKKTYLM